jgi:cytoskeletal protein CcmA (bactofilin family)
MIEKMEEWKMSFFKDFKEDLSQAVNELMPEETDQGKDDMQMVDTLTDEGEFKEPSIEEMLKNIEDIGIENITASEFGEKPLEESYAFEGIPDSEEETATATDTMQMEFMMEETLIPESHEEIIEEMEETRAYEEPTIEQEVAQIMEEENAVLFNEERVTNETGIITEGMLVKGDISTAGNLEVTGGVEGNLEVKGKLVVTGSITGNSKAEEVFADAAKIIGEIESIGAVKIGQNTVVKGNIKATSAVLAGAVKGDIDVHGPVILDVTAIIMGNIKSKSIQINNGAVIEGLCSQCYAEVSPKNFFEDDKVTKDKK